MCSFNFLNSEILIKPFQYLIFEYEKGKLVNDKIYIKDVNLDYKGIETKVKNKYKNAKIDYKEWFEIEEDYYSFDDDGKIEINYKIKMPKKLKSEVALELFLEFEPKMSQNIKRIYNTSIYLIPKNKKINIEVNNENIKIKKNIIEIELYNKSNIHIRPKLELTDLKNDKTIYFYDREPIFQNEKKVFQSYEIQDQFIDFDVQKKFKLKILDIKNKINISKNIEIKKVIDYEK
jgi:hypothetical protein